MNWLNTRLAGFRCPACRATQSAARIWRTDRTGDGLDHFCPNCGAGLRLGNGRGRYKGFSALVFLGAASAGLVAAHQVDALTFINGGGERRVSLTGFLIVILGLVLPATALCQRLLNVEVVK